MLAVIQSFADKTIERIWLREITKRIGPEVQRLAQRKLRQLNAAESLNDLRVPPGNRLEALKGSRRGQHSIRVNDQFRICFRWTSNGPKDVELTDYH
jgi:proteic killer suppression protein